MKKELIKEVIRSFHKSTFPPVKARSLTIPFDTNKIITLTGVRRSGKTYTLINSMKELLARSIPVEKILYINFEDERIILQQEEANMIIQAYRELYPDLNLAECYLFFDEVQNLPGWEKFIRRIYDTISHSIYITGSNSRLLSKEIATALRGRTVTYEIYPLTFREFIQFHGVEIDLYHSRSKAHLFHLFEHFLTEGGFPEILSQDDNSFKTKILQEYFDVMLYRDLIDRYSIANLSVLKYFMRRITESIGSSFSVNKLYNELKSAGFKVGKNILYDYLEYFNAIYLFFTVRKYMPSVVKQEHGEKKIYMIDNGLLNASTFKYSHDYGKLLENLVFDELTKHGYLMFFYKDKRECDFLIFEKSALKGALQVCYSVAAKETLNREIAGLREVCTRFNLKKGTILTYSEEGKLRESDISISIIPAYKYLLEMGTGAEQ